ncbi:hypothetical protein ACX27_17745 [Nostoc piscinale CENA21]|uniref:Uncharacterized protein n=1 Tax=Nostoc piscinale CENA21 TaxID=224013 RepID=A0A0M4T5I8_9NOSO|nr:hypothetical protein [Nostoc piscinale]ALF54266.1 hypothetical protein ACX27_17745 [Nostoc piscinale CENA21]
MNLIDFLWYPAWRDGSDRTLVSSTVPLPDKGDFASQTHYLRISNKVESSILVENYHSQLVLNTQDNYQYGGCLPVNSNIKSPKQYSRRNKW